MGKPKKNELDIVLEQLKKSYSSDTELEDSLLESEISEEDMELNAVLKGIFSDKNESENKTEKGIEDDSSDSVKSDIAINYEKYEEESRDFDDVLHISDSDIASEKKAVDGVLEAMLGNSFDEKSMNHSENEYVEASGQDGSPSSATSDIPRLGMQEEAETDKFNDDAEQLGVQGESNEEASTDISDADQNMSDDNDTETQFNVTDDFEKDNNESGMTAEFDDLEADESDELVDTIGISDGYIYEHDALQHGIDEMPFIKLVGDITPKEQEAVAAEETETEEPCNQGLNGEDISLMLKFQYGDELKQKITDEQIYDAVSEKENSFEPAQNRIPHGFCGRELTDRVQIDRIRKKYSQDKKFLIIAIVAISLLLVLSLIADISVMTSADGSVYANVILWELLFIVVTTVFLLKKLYIGIVGIVKFEINQYSLLVIALIGYCLYSIGILAVYDGLNSILVSDTQFMTFGTYVMFYVLVTVLCDFFECKSELNTFGVIADNEAFYTADKRIGYLSAVLQNGEQSIKSVSHQKVAYNVVSTHLVGGYFERMSRKNSILYPMYAIGTVPALSIILGCVSAILSNNIYYGIYSAIFTLFLCISFITVLLSFIYEFSVSRELKKKNTAFVGYQAVNDCACVEELIINDGDAVETISCVEINPNKGSRTERYLDIAHEVLGALGGTLRGDYGDAERLRREIIINAISDNGIDIYFDSAMNVLIGDRQYMLSNKIKVKTDTSLSQATKGNDRSVIYMAFDGNPRLGFIVTNKITNSFAYVLRLLDSNDIGTVVRSYEPHINDDFFSRNDFGGEFDIRVLKQDVYEPCECRKICSGIVVSKDITGVAEAIVSSKDIVRNRNKLKEIRIAVEIVGIVMSVAISLLMSIPNLSGIALFLRSNMLVVFYTLTALLSLPCVLFLFNILLKKKRKK